jgi:cellulose synthase/poly-beta-1,6-N-acetylglucosamine synthase-like glycosyltransferase
MKNIEIPYVSDRGVRYRLFEILPGFLSWSLLALPFILSFISPYITAFFIIGYLLLWTVKSAGMSIRALQGFKVLNQHQRLPWNQMLAELQAGKVVQPDKQIPTWHYDNIRRIQEEPTPIHPNDAIHALVLATYNEAKEVLEPTIQSVLASEFDMKRVILVIAFEERGGAGVEKNVHELIAAYKDKFMHAMAVKHPKDVPGEVIGKGGNITYAGRELQKYVEHKGLDPLKVIVTTLDADNRPHKYYLAALTYVYSLCYDPRTVSFQPVPVFTNNIWDAPAPMRVIATGNTFWNVVLSLRPHMIRNFSSHAQSMQTIIDTDFWSVRTIVEDGHQFWRTYFRYDGRHEVYPIYLPIYQDAVLSSTYRKTLKAQFIQLRRWAWGASDVAYVLEKGFFTPNKVPKADLIAKFSRLLEGHVSWATAPLILAFAAFIPLLFHPQDYAANQLPHIASTIQTIALAGIFVTLFLSLKILPPKPARYKSHRTIFMVVQWLFLPVTTIAYNALSALYSQTRLMFGKYIDKFDVTDKAVITEDKRKVI